MFSMFVKDYDYRSQPDVWGNNDHQHGIKLLSISIVQYANGGMCEIMFEIHFLGLD